MRSHTIIRWCRQAARMTAAAAVMVACSNNILEVDTPNVLSESALGGSLGATTLRNGAIQDFTVNFSGTQDGFIVSTGNMGDEVQTSDTFADRYFTDGRKQTEVMGGALNSIYNGLQTSRAGFASAIKTWTAVKSATNAAAKDSLSELYTLRGVSENLFAEAFCSGVPFSSVDADGNFDYGMPQTTAQTLTRAVASIDSALALAAGATYVNLARVSKGRALLNQGNFAAAATAVNGVPTNFVYRLFHSNATARQRNGIHAGTFVAGSRYTVGTREGGNGLDYLTTPADPRVPWTPSTRTGFDGTSRNLPQEQKYNNEASSVVLADGIEARLIEAEARLQGGTQADRDAVFGLLNTLRATGITPGMPAIAGAAPTTQAAAVDLLFSERAKWLWLTGHRLGDMRRLIRQYGRAANTVFPVGPMTLRPGDTYGTDVNFIVPVREKNNPNFSGCIDRNP
jgi:hypothetical protein